MACRPLLHALDTLGVYYARDFGVACNGTTDDSAALSALLSRVGAAGGGRVLLPPGTVRCNGFVTWPAYSGITLAGYGRDVTTLQFSASTTGGIVYNSPTRIYHSFLQDMSIHGGGAASGIGLDLNDWDSGGFKRLRIYAWDTCVKLTSTATRGALRNRFEDCILTNGTTNGVWLTGAQGCHETSFSGGQISLNGTGLFINNGSGVAALTDDTTVWRTQMESNGTAIRTNGVRSFYSPRLEGNTTDVYFDTFAAYNILQTGYFDPAKHVDVATVSGIGTNRVLPYGPSSGITERLAPLFLPIDPMCLPLTSQVPGAALSVSHLFHLDEMRKVATLTIVPSVQAGNVALAITDAGGTVLGSTPSTAVGAVGTRQDIALSSTLFLPPARDYYYSLMFDGGGGVYGYTGTTAGSALMGNEIGGRQKTLAYTGSTPFVGQNPISGGSSTTIVPAVRIG